MAEPTLDITSLKPASITFVLRNVDHGLANAFRRVLIADVPTMGTRLRPLSVCALRKRGT